MLAGCGEDQVAIRDTGIMARRLVRAPRPAERAERWTPRGTVLITGGTGAIGGHVARWTAGRGARRVMLTSRAGPSAAGAAELAAALAGTGTAVAVAACDIGQREQVTGLLAWASTSGPPVSSVVHAAGAGQSTAVNDVTTAELAAVTAAKAAGASHLDELTRDLELDAFVLFSSIAATWGSGQQPGYAAANAYLDALAEHRRGTGLTATSVAWGPWAGGGMTDTGAAARLAMRGLVTQWAPELALAALGEALDAAEPQLTIADVDWQRFATSFTACAGRQPAVGAVPGPSGPTVATTSAAATRRQWTGTRWLGGWPG